MTAQPRSVYGPFLKPQLGETFTDLEGNILGCFRVKLSALNRNEFYYARERSDLDAYLAARIHFTVEAL